VFLLLTFSLALRKHSEADAKPGRKEGVMAKLIEFHIPAKFQLSRKRWTPEELRGKIIDFRPVTKKSA